MSRPPRDEQAEPTGLRVLLIEDSDGDADLVADILAEAGPAIALRRVTTIAAAIEALERQPADVMLLDLSLPDALGLDGLRRLLAAHGEVPIVVLTGSLDEALGTQAIAEGAQDFLPKGAFEGALLVRSIRYARERQLLMRRAAMQARERELRVAAEAAHRASDERATELAAILRAIPEIVLVYDEAGVIRRANAAARERFGFDPVGLAAAEVAGRIGLSSFDGTPADENEAPALRAVRVDETVTDQPTVFHGVDAQRHIVQRVATPFRRPRPDDGGDAARSDSATAATGASGKPAAEGAVVVWRDITEREQLLEALRDADGRKNEFLGVLSHELRNPLAPIRNSLFLLEKNPRLDERSRRYTEVISRQAGHLARLVDDLLDVTRISRGKVRLQRAPLDLVDIVRRGAEDMRSLFRAAGVRFAVRTPEGPVMVDGDAARLAQIVGNLLANAAKFTPAGGRVTLALSEDRARGEARLEVTDSGVGIEPEMLGHVFEPFTQADRSLDRAKGGLGLGLALTKGLVELHGGTIEATSEGPGRGASFTVWLPTLAAQAPRAASAAGEERTRRLRLLVVEDNEDAADTLREALEMFGHEVTVAYDGPEGVAAARRRPPDVVVCDIGLPGMTGYDLARVFRADPRLRAVRLVALTGYAGPEAQRQAAEAGFERHLAKPADLEVLRTLLNEFAIANEPALLGRKEQPQMGSDTPI